MPAIGFGTWNLSEDGEVQRAVSEALEVGYRLIDTAKIYRNERGVGEAIRASGIKRQEILVTTKLWPGDFGYDSALAAFDASLAKLGLDYVDLYLMHWPGHSAQDRQDSWRALERIYEEGRVKAIGVSNYGVEHLEEMAGASVQPAVNQIELHPFNYAEQVEVLEFCKRREILVEAYSPLNQGRGLDHPVLVEVASKYKKSPGQVMLRWAIQHGTVPIPKSAKPERIRENFAVFDFELLAEEMSAIDKLLQ